VIIALRDGFATLFVWSSLLSGPGTRRRAGQTCNVVCRPSPRRGEPRFKWRRWPLGHTMRVQGERITALHAQPAGHRPVSAPRLLYRHCY